MVIRLSVSSHPELPASPRPTVYSDVTISEFIPYWNIIENVPEQSRETRNKPTPMEQLDINNGNGQSYGYIVYRKTLVLRPGMKLKIRGHPRDLVQVIILGSVRSSGSRNLRPSVRPVLTCLSQFLSFWLRSLIRALSAYFVGKTEAKCFVLLDLSMTFDHIDIDCFCNLSR